MARAPTSFDGGTGSMAPEGTGSGVAMASPVIDAAIATFVDQASVGSNGPKAYSSSLMAAHPWRAHRLSRKALRA